MPFWRRKTPEKQQDDVSSSSSPFGKGRLRGISEPGKSPLPPFFKEGNRQKRLFGRHRDIEEVEVWLVVGLGNPGEKYARSHHNIGFMCLDYYAREHNITLERSRLKAKDGEGKFHGKRFILAKPQTFMNLSGEAVGRLVRRYHVKPANLVVVHDEMDLPLGRIRIRLGGSSAGHNGIKSIVDNISTEEFVRVRVGVGRPESERGQEGRREIIGFVLGDFTREEQKVVEKVVPAVGQAIDVILSEGVTAAMNKFNGVDLAKEETN